MKPFFSRRVYAVLLLAYPREFRREYGPLMAQLLRDCERDASSRGALIAVWIRTLTDLARTLPVEHLENLRKESQGMSKLRNDLAAIGGCLLVIALSAFLLSYGRSHQIPAILVFGYVLDAIVFTGIAGNLIVLLLVKLTTQQPLKIAFWTFLFVCVVSVIGITVLVSRVDPSFSLPNVLIGYLGSFFFWYGLHWLWTQKLRESNYDIEG